MFRLPPVTAANPALLSANPPHIAQRLWDQARMDGYEWGVRHRRRKGSRMPTLTVQGRMADEYVERLPESYRLTRQDKAYIHAGYAVGLRRGIAGGEPPKMPNPSSATRRVSNPTAERYGLTTKDLTKLSKIWDEYVKGASKFDRRGISRELRRFLDDYRIMQPDGTVFEYGRNSDATVLPVELLWKYVKPMVGSGTGYSITKNKGWENLNIYPVGSRYFTDRDLREMERILAELENYGYITYLAAGSIWEIYPSGKQKNPATNAQLDEAIAAAGMAGLDWHAKHPRLAKQKARVNAASAAPSARIAKRYGITGRGSRAGVKAVRDAWKLGAMGGGVAASGNPKKPVPWMDPEGYDAYMDKQAAARAKREAKKRAAAVIPAGSIIRFRGNLGAIAGEFDVRMIEYGEQESLVENVRTGRQFKAPSYTLFRKNPFPGFGDAVADADRLYESFHGKAPTKTTVVHTPIAIRDSLSELGLLRQLKVKLLTGKRVAIDFPDSGRDAVMLCSSPDGRQLYFVGGDQSINLRSAGMAGQPWERDHMALGVLLEVTYRTMKGFDKFQLTDYYHKLGEETKVQPILAYDTLNNELSVVGGQYKVKPEGIVN